MSEIVCAGMFLLITGSYGWAWILYTRLGDRIEQLFSNHVGNLEERIATLQARLNAQ